MATTTVARRAGIRFPAWRAEVVVVGAAAVLLSYLTLVPLAMLLLGSVSGGASVLDFQLTLRNFQRVLTDQASLELLANSLLYGAGAATLAFVIGTAVAWAVERTDVPGRSLWYGIALVPIIIPGIVHTIAWLFLLSPEIGWINAPLKAVFGVPLSIYSLPGMIWVEGLHTAPFAFVLMSAALRAMDPSLEEAAAASRANPWSTFRRITLPLLLPAIASVLLILFVRALEGFEVPAIIGLPGRIYVYTSRIYTSLNQYPPNFGLSAAYASVLLAISVVGLVLHNRATRRTERYTTVTGKAYRPRRVALGRYRYIAVAALGLYGALAIVLPFLVLIYASLVRVYSVPSLDSFSELTLRNYAFIFTDELTRRSFVNSVVLGVLAASVVVALTSVIAWVTLRTRIPGRGLLDFLAFVPITIPGIVLGISLLWVYFTIPIRIYGTIWILLVAYVTRYLPYGIRATTAGLAQLHKELEEAAATAGARWWPTFQRVLLPLLRPTLVGAWVYVFIVSLRELGSSILLASSDNVVLAVRIFDLRDSGNYTTIAALSVILIIMLVALVAILQRVGGRTVREA
ncbi:MAG TPA: iron ABC transporter permease [Candidatus Limnocylindria bacterium]|jgi:iron(III) transport system permease protein|nr:iron ABC transporter permease [Candidatus Limnocylindria bacterium]